VPGSTPIRERIERNLAPHLARASHAGNGDPA
jgi:hypothetical protein